MNALASPDAIEPAASVEPAVKSVIRNFVEHEYAAHPPESGV
jgi:hypothetical protein